METVRFSFLFTFFTNGVFAVAFGVFCLALNFLHLYLSIEKIVRAALFMFIVFVSTITKGDTERKNSQKCIETLAHFIHDGIVGTT